jgi:hypothetical protein
MTHNAGFEPDRLLLLPEAADDYVDADNPVRFIDAFVDGPDLLDANEVHSLATRGGGVRPGGGEGDGASFGSIKQWIYQGAFLMRGPENVCAEFSLTALAYNLRRALSILGVGPMMAAVPG